VDQTTRNSFGKGWKMLLWLQGADPGFVGLEAYTILGTLLKKKRTKLRIQN
jgi:hypothetical protein